VSASKEHFGGGGAGDRRAFYDVSPRKRCPVCEHDSWCQVHREGTFALCKRVASERPPKENREGTQFWVHALAGDAVWRARDLGPRPGSAPRAPAAALDRAYRRWLARAGLAPAHRRALRARALSDAEIDARGYATLELRGRAALARALVDELGEDLARGVPGLYVREQDGRTWWTLAGSPGLLVPVRDLADQVVALKVRRDDAAAGQQRYLYVSSARHGGPSALPALHVPRFGGVVDDVRITEGELKGDVITALSGVLTLAVPGVGSWGHALPALRELRARRVRVAFDADHRTNPDVARALLALVRALQAAGYAPVVETWDPAEGKGFDDVLAARARGRETAA
jgi:hypothetical protein